MNYKDPSQALCRRAGKAIMDCPGIHFDSWQAVMAASTFDKDLDTNAIYKAKFNLVREGDLRRYGQLWCKARLCTEDHGQNYIEDICRVLCKSGKFETGQGTCAALCMGQLGEARRDCMHVKQVHGKLAEAIVVALDKSCLRRPWL